MGGDIIVPGQDQQLRQLAAMQEAAMAQRDATMPNKGEQRRIACVQFAIQAGIGTGEGTTDAKALIAGAAALDKFILSGPNS